MELKENNQWKNKKKYIEIINDLIEWGKENDPEFEENELSDGYHTFNELYEFRKQYNAALFNEWAKSDKYDVHKSKKHYDGEDCFGGGWFIVVAILPGGQISNHYKLKDWDLFNIPECHTAKMPFDGHTGRDVLERLESINLNKYHTMPTRISFSTHYPDRMGDLAGRPTRFPEKLITMIDPFAENEKLSDSIFQLAKSGVYDFNFKVNYIPKTTTIRSNYEYWKKKEGQLIQPFFWAGKPYRSKQVVFCPEVRLKKVEKIEIDIALPMITIENDDRLLFIDDGRQLEYFTQNEGFDHPDHFWMWFNQDFDGAYLELESVEG